MNRLNVTRTLALGLLLLGAVAMPAQEPRKQIPARKLLVPVAAPEVPLLLEVFVEVMRAQPDPEKGLEATVVFLNRSEEPVTILDPRYFTHLTIGMEDGRPLTYPSTAGDELTQNTGERESTVASRYVTIEPRRDYRVTVTVTEVYPYEPPRLSADGSISLYPTNPPVRIEGGRYRVGAMTAIARPQQPLVHLRSESVAVVLGGGAE